MSLCACVCARARILCVRECVHLLCVCIIYIYIYIYIYIFVSVCVCLYICMYVCIRCVCVCVCALHICTQLYIKIHEYTSKYIHTRPHINIYQEDAQFDQTSSNTSCKHAYMHACMLAYLVKQPHTQKVVRVLAMPTWKGEKSSPPLSWLCSSRQTYFHMHAHTEQT
jgi:hypothetical protein